MIPATYPSILDSSNRTKMLVYQVPSIVGLTRWIDYIPVKSPASESDLTLANTFANEGFILTSKVNDITGLVPFKDYVPIYLDSTATKAWSADNDGYIPMAELAGLLLDFTTGALDPRIDFTRATNATVTNSAGLITYAPHNLLTHSEQFDNAAWLKVGTATSTSNTTIAPDGTQTADTVTNATDVSWSVGNGIQRQITSLISSTAYAFSLYIRGIAGTTAKIAIRDQSTGLVTESAALTLTSEWQRVSISRTTGASTTALGLLIGATDGTVAIWGAQLEIGSTATTYNSTTVKNLLGFSEAYDNATWTKSNSFVQTNLLTYSEDFTVAGWAKTTVTATANSFIAPNGYQTADTLLATGANSTALQTFTASAVPYTFSVYLYRKTGTGNIDITVDGTTWVTKTITAGWTRVDTTLTPAAGSKTAGIRIVTSGDEVYAWGAQLVQGSVAGDYRRTDAAALPVYYPNHNGVVCAEQLHGTADNGTILESYTASGAPMTFSVWMRRITGTGNVDITMDTGVTWTTQAITTSWARYSITTSPTAGARTAGIRLVTSGDVIQVFGGMVSDSASLDPYVLNAAAAPTAAAYYGPRFDYDPVTLAPKGLLIEEQRTNSILYSNTLSNAAWIKPTVTLTENNITSPDGALNGIKVLVKAAITILPGPYQSFTATAQSYTNSLYAKAGTINWIGVSFGTTDAKTDGAYFNLSTGVVGTVAAGTTASIQSVGNGWYRCSITRALTAGTRYMQIEPHTADNQGIWSPAGTETLYLFGTQVEAGAFATSYIPTAASQVTRAADVATIQGSNFYSWINQNAGSLYAQFSTPASGNRNIIALDDNTANNNIRLRTEGTDPYLKQAWVGTEQVALDLGTVAANTVYKIAASYQINDYAGVIANGTVGTDTVANTPIMTMMRLGTDQAGAYLNSTIKTFTYYPQKLSDSVLKGLTA